MLLLSFYFFFFFNDTATTEIYTLSLHDALPICRFPSRRTGRTVYLRARVSGIRLSWSEPDRKSTRLNSSHGYISYAVFCLKKKKKTKVHSGNQAQLTNNPLDQNPHDTAESTYTP